jgi:hypothetical protein
MGSGSRGAAAAPGARSSAIAPTDHQRARGACELGRHNVLVSSRRRVKHAALMIRRRYCTWSCQSWPTSSSCARRKSKGKAKGT